MFVHVCGSVGVCAHECSYPQSPEEGAGSPGAGIAGGYGLPDMG